MIHPYIYIQGSPRTGSTLLYQVLIHITNNTLYISNECNESFKSNPSAYFEKNQNLQLEYKNKINFTSKYGKTKGDLGPSEGSGIMMNWFGGGHPTETVSCDFLPNKKNEFVKFHEYISDTLGSSLITKNAWNCFRIPAIVSTGMNFFFILIRRNLVDCALSDLDSRLSQGDPNKIWNSASPKNYKELQKRPFWEQVVEQQFEYNDKMLTDLKKENANFVELWYEDLCENPKKIMRDLCQKIEIELNENINYLPLKFNTKKHYKYINDKDVDKVISYVKNNQLRFRSIYKYMLNEKV